MKFVTYISNMHELSLAREYGIGEVLLADKQLSRTGRLDIQQVAVLAQVGKELGLKTVLVWDTLATEFDFKKQQAFFDSVDLTNIDCVRVGDPGVAYYLLSKNIPMQLSLENGNHNLVGIQKWVEVFRPVLDKVILSIELPESKIATYCHQLDIPVEILGAGPILLFYTPRKLLGAQLDKGPNAVRSEDFIEALAESEESPHKGFPVIENRHGTYMFHIKNFFILEHHQKLAAQGLHSLRIDLTDNQMDFLASFHQFLKGDLPLSDLKVAYGKETIRGFYHINKSDVLFKKLKNHRIQRKDDSYIGEVIDVIKGRFIIVQIKSGSLQVGSSIRYITPEGKELESIVERLCDLDQKTMESVSVGDMVMINYRGGILTKSQIYN